ncbi:MAG: exodeoxyribonuclease III [Planctomycetes bacterium]|nr:exodeoxyribonuclease III [Planctomycetota bacterium]
MRVVTWNVNGIRACEGKGFSRWLAGAGADVVGVQEVRAREAQLPPTLAALAGWHRHVVAAEQAGYSGVGLFSRREPDDVETSLSEARFDREGRLQVARFGRLVVVNGYFPNGNGPNRDHSRIPYKLDFYRAVFERVERLRRGGARVLVMGDFNTAHREIDLARPKENVATSGFTPAEREELDRWLRAGWVDTFRRFEPGPGHYSWWSQRQGARQRNVGWRIDYVLGSPNVVPFLRGAWHQPTVLGSDHCPVGVDLDPAVVAR